MFENTTFGQTVFSMFFCFPRSKLHFGIDVAKGKKTDSWLSHLEFCHLGKDGFSEPQCPHL